MTVKLGRLTAGMQKSESIRDVLCKAVRGVRMNNEKLFEYIAATFMVQVDCQSPVCNVRHFEITVDRPSDTSCRRLKYIV